MQIRYCDGCSSRIESDDAITVAANVYCRGCAASRNIASKSNGGSAPTVGPSNQGIQRPDPRPLIRSNSRMRSVDRSAGHLPGAVSTQRNLGNVIVIGVAILVLGIAVIFTSLRTTPATPAAAPAIPPPDTRKQAAPAVKEVPEANVAPAQPAPAVKEISIDASDTVWIEDSLPEEAHSMAENGDGWNWVSTNPIPFSGSRAHQSNVAFGSHQHMFDKAATPLIVNADENLIAYVFLDVEHPPTEIMLQFFAGTWEHRVYWGKEELNYGACISAGALPPIGKWMRLEFSPKLVDVENRPITGMAFSLRNGRATWDHIGKAPKARTNK